MESSEKPGILNRVASFTGAVVTHVLTGMVKVSPQELERRNTICRGGPQTQRCEFFAEPDGCSKCGCEKWLLGIGGWSVKASWAEQHCPAGKW